jgi:transposase InsO family protein
MQMTAYAEQRRAQKRRAQKRRGRQPAQPPLSPERAAWLSRSQELQVQRRRFRVAAKASDAEWRQLRQARRQQKAAWRALSLSDQRQRSAQNAAADDRWQQDRDARRAEMAERRAADLAWRQARQALCAEEAQWKPMAQPVVTWLAILVIIDNCTRQCLGLPCFTDGIHVTAEVVVEALRQFLPAGLKFIISDNGSYFRSDALAALAQQAHFVHVRIAPYRARTNGIAERFVRTLKEELQGESWSTPEEVPGLLAQQLKMYNERPHQGRELAGLSPNEYANRLRLGATY